MEQMHPGKVLQSENTLSGVKCYSWLLSMRLLKLKSYSWQLLKSCWILGGLQGAESSTAAWNISTSLNKHRYTEYQNTWTGFILTALFSPQTDHMKHWILYLTLLLPAGSANIQISAAEFRSRPSSRHISMAYGEQVIPFCTLPSAAAGYHSVSAWQYQKNASSWIKIYKNV